jgi:hypothetical protein
MLGRVGTALGLAGINIVSAAVGHRPGSGTDDEAIMIVTTDTQVPQPVLASLLADQDFFAARSVSL